MTPREFELERQLIEVRKAAVEMLVGMARGAASTHAGREDIAKSFDEVAKSGSGEAQRLARLVAAALRG
ncbi:hypothetical protein [Salipiger sp. PrR003]|uniref:hypothetical protein n=1 Tax=Salipiger sp. PrR003 TaxID=2706776 RepID=UPI0013DB478B|nr:hypothetical protein [Salipiger sp. PrR003]NDV52134.1 hypothetical protein [Salipiger sp. PrR003]